MAADWLLSAHRYIDLHRITGVCLESAFLVIVVISTAGEPFLKNILPQIPDCLNIRVLTGSIELGIHRENCVSTKARFHAIIPI